MRDAGALSPAPVRHEAEGLVRETEDTSVAPRFKHGPGSARTNPRHAGREDYAHGDEQAALEATAGVCVDTVINLDGVASGNVDVRRSRMAERILIRI